MNRIKVVPTRGFDGHIQGWAVNDGAWELAFYKSRTRALNEGMRYADLAVDGRLPNRT